MSRDDAVRAAAEVMRDDGWTCDYHDPTEPCGECDRARAHTAAAMIQAAAPHLTADLVRERDAFRDGYERAMSTAAERLRKLADALVEVERLRNPTIATPRELSALRTMEQAIRERDEALAEVERMRDEVAHADRAVAAAVDQGIARAEGAEATIARVEALCDDPRQPGDAVWTDDIRAALRGDA